MDPFLLPMYASVLGVAGAVLLIRSLMFELNVFSPSTVDSTPSVLATYSQITINLIEGGFRFTVAAYLVQASSGVRAMRRAAWLGFLAVLVHAVMLYWATHRSTHNSPRAFFMSWLGGVNAKYWLAINLVDWAQFSALLVFQAVRAFQHGTAALRPSSTGFLVFLWLVFGSFVGVELLSVSMESQSQGVYRAQSEAATCWTICTSGCYYLLWPPILYWALRRDSLQWRQLAVKYNGANHSWSRSQPSGQTSADSSSTRAGRFGTDTSAEGPRALLLPHGSGVGLLPGGGSHSSSLQSSAHTSLTMQSSTNSEVGGERDRVGIAVTEAAEGSSNGTGLEQQLHDHFGREFGSSIQVVDFLQLEFQSCIGVGSSAKVYRAVLRGRPVAVKAFRPSEITPDAVLERMVEVDILSQVQLVQLV
jgi:hypothetical protein